MRKLYVLLTGLFMCLVCNLSAQNPTPDVANFTFTVNAANNDVVFANTSVLGTSDGPRKAYWHFGDGSIAQTGPLQGTQHHYNAAGTYTVCLKIYRYGFNTNDSVLTASVCKTVVIQSAECSANFESPSTTPTGGPGRYFVAQPGHSQNKKPVRICWNFGDGRDTCIQYTSSFTGPYAVFHLYNQPGNYNVCVNILYDGGCQASKCKIVEVPAADSCRAGFERIDAAGTVNPLNAYFKALPWHSNNKKPVYICWSFGDNRDTCIQYSNTFTGPYVVNHTYSQPGVYEVCVRIRYEGGCESRKCENIRIGRPDSCSADFERLGISTAANPLTQIFKAIPGHNNNKKPARICWTFGDGRDTCIEYLNIYNGNYTVPHTYSQPGNYEVCVRIVYFGGCEARKCRVVQIPPADICAADFERIPVVAPNNTLLSYFKAIPTHNNNKKPARICWTFGDGRDTCITYPENYTGQYAVSHLYAQPGQYEVCVRINYYGGCEARKCRVITVTRPDTCGADFERLPLASTNNPLQAYFKALPSHNNNKKPQKICWTFGDGRDTCITYPENFTGTYAVGHTYAQPGQYEVCVRILYFGGCEARKCRVITIPPPNPPVCSVNLFEITQSINSTERGFLAVPHTEPASTPTQICWNFGDGTDTCITLTPGQPPLNLGIRHNYPGPGVYRACVRIRYANGCIAEKCIEVVIRANNHTGLCGGYMTDSITGPRTVKFKGFSIADPNDEVLYYRWSFGDGTTAVGREQTHTYTAPGEYRVCLSIKTRSNCETNICKTVRIPGTTNQATLVLTPNPVITVLNALFLSTQTEPVTIRIMNGFGTAVRTYTRNAVAGANTWTFDLASLLPGIYTFIVQSPNQLASGIFIKN